jgi:hypothetical protein
MKKRRSNQSGSFRLCMLFGLLVFFAGVLLALFAATNPQVSRGERTGDTGGHVGHLNRVAVAAAGGVNEAWVARYNGPGNSIDEARSIAVDNSGNVYVAGTSYGSETLRDYATIKYDSAGQEQWVARYNGPEKGDDRLMPWSLTDRATSM